MIIIFAIFFIGWLMMSGLHYYDVNEFLNLFIKILENKDCEITIGDINTAESENGIMRFTVNYILINGTSNNISLTLFSIFTFKKINKITQLLCNKGVITNF